MFLSVILKMIEEASAVKPILMVNMKVVRHQNCQLTLMANPKHQDQHMAGLPLRVGMLDNLIQQWQSHTWLILAAQKARQLVLVHQVVKFAYLLYPS